MGSTRLPSAKSSVLPLAAALSALSAALLARAVHGQIPACGLDSSYYEAAADAFPVDVTATAGNPFKGLATSPAWHSSLPYRTNIPASLEFHFLSLASVMDGPASFTFAAGLEPALIASASRDTHAVLRFWVDFPNQDAVGVPQYLVDAGLTFNAFSAHGGGRSPDYHDSRLIDAFVAFAAALGAQYDGDPRIAAVQIGLVGFWGEWHTYPDMAWMPSVTDQNRVIAAFDGAFNTTELEILSSKSGLTNSANVGFHDNSFTFATLDVAANATHSTPAIRWFYEPQLAASGATSSWTHSMIGGEVRGENQATLFDSDFGAPDTYKQDFDQCVAATHASWMVNRHAFAQDGGYSGAALSAAQASVSGMGYNLRITSVVATVVDAVGCNGVSWPCAAVDVAIANDGVAPFYYDLAPLLDLPVLCSPNQSVASIPASPDPTTATLTRRSLGLANAAQFRFYVSGSSGCLPALKLRLSSTKAYAGRPVKLAHTYDGSGVSLNIPDHPCPVSTTEDPSPPTNPSTSTVTFAATTTDAPNLNNGAASSADDSSTAATAGIAAAVVVLLLGLVGVVVARRRRQRHAGAPTAKAASERADHADDGLAGVQWRGEERAPDALELVTLNATLPAGGSDASPDLDVATVAANPSDLVGELVESDVVGELVGAGPRASFADEAGRRASFAEETIVW